MKFALTALLAGTLALAAGSTPTGAWGFDPHRYLTDRAIDQLPAAIKPFFVKHRAFIVEHSIDPDLWRSAGFAEEPPRHFVDLDAYGKEAPFPELPRSQDEAVQKFGREFVEKNGTLPWRGAEMYGELVRAFLDQKRGTVPWATDNVKFFAAALAHYTEDAHVPLHAITNYDGQLSDQHGIHSRFETDLFVRFQPRLGITPIATAPVTSPREFLFKALLDSFRSAQAVLDADREALGTGTAYDDAYYERFLGRAQPVLEQRMSAAIGGVAAMITGAWEAAGRPDLPLQPPRRVRTKRVRSTSD